MRAILSPVILLCASSLFLSQLVKMKRFRFQNSDLRLNPQSLWLTLTEREKQIARLSAQGKRTRDIANELCLSPKTVDTYFKQIFRKLQIHSRIELANVVRASND